METDNLIEQVANLIGKIKEQDIKFGLYLEDHMILDNEQGAIYYFGKKLTDINDLLITVVD